MLKNLALALSIFSTCCAAGGLQVKPTPEPIIYIVGELNASAAIIEITLMDLAAKTSPAIYVVLNTQGGEVRAGLALRQEIEHLQAQNVRVDCIVDERAESMGFYILQACDTRAMTKRATLMVHEPMLEITGNRYVLREQAKYLDTLASVMSSFECKRLKISCADFDSRIENEEWWMDWKEALRVGAIDSIIDWRDIPKPSQSPLMP